MADEAGYVRAHPAMLEHVEVLGKLWKSQRMPARNASSDILDVV